jgi:hypothetical protein
MPSSGSVDVDVNVTWSPVFGEAGELPNAAVGPRFVALTTWLVLALAPLLSVTRRRTVWLPGVEKLVWALAPVPSS